MRESGNLPKWVGLADGKAQLMPNRTILLNPEEEKKTRWVYYVWATVGEGSNTYSLPEAVENSDIKIYAWFTDDPQFVQNAYKRSAELGKMLVAVASDMEVKEEIYLDFAMILSDVMATSSGVIAHIGVGLEPTINN